MKMVKVIGFIWETPSPFKLMMSTSLKTNSLNTVDVSILFLISENDKDDFQVVFIVFAAVNWSKINTKKSSRKCKDDDVSDSVMTM